MTIVEVAAWIFVIAFGAPVLFGMLTLGLMAVLSVLVFIGAAMEAKSKARQTQPANDPSGS